MDKRKLQCSASHLSKSMPACYSCKKETSCLKIRIRRKRLTSGTFKETPAHDTAHVSHGSCSAAVSCSFFCNSLFFCFCCSISACTFPLHSVHGSLKARVSEMVSALKLSDFTALLDTKTLSIFKHKIHAACSIQTAFAFCTRRWLHLCKQLTLRGRWDTTRQIVHTVYSAGMNNEIIQPHQWQETSLHCRGFLQFLLQVFGLFSFLCDLFLPQHKPLK